MGKEKTEQTDENLNNPSKRTQVLEAAKSLAESPENMQIENQTPPPPPNIIWSSEKNDKGELLHGEPPEAIRVGMLNIELPDAATQRKGFYSPHAALLTQIKAGYKILKPKG